MLNCSILYSNAQDLLCIVYSEWAVFRDILERLHGEASYPGNRLTLAERGRNGHFRNK